MSCCPSLLPPCSPFLQVLVSSTAKRKLSLFPSKGVRATVPRIPPHATVRRALNRQQTLHQRRLPHLSSPYLTFPFAPPETLHHPPFPHLKIRLAAAKHTNRFESDCGGNGAGGPGSGSSLTVRVDMETFENLCVLKRASLKMADGLASGRGGGGGGGGGRGVIPAMHLKSDGNVVSCFDAGERHLLVVAAEMHAASVELFNTSVSAGGAGRSSLLYSLVASRAPSHPLVLPACQMHWPRCAL